MEGILAQYYEVQSEEGSKSPSRPGEYAGIGEAIDHVSGLLSERRQELTSVNLKIETAARKNNIGVINMLVLKRIALELVIDNMERMQVEMNKRQCILKRRIDFTLEQLERLYIAARRDAQALVRQKKNVAASESWLVNLQAQHIDREGRTYFGDKLTQKIAEEQFHHLGRYDECETARLEVQKHFDKIESIRSELLEVGYPLDDDLYQALGDLLQSPLYGDATLQLVSVRQEQQDRACQQNDSITGATLSG